MLRSTSFFILALVTQVVFAADKGLTTEKEKLGYVIGLQTVFQWEQSGLELELSDVDLKAMMMAIQDKLEGKQERLAPQELNASIQKFQQTLQTRKAEAANKNKAAGDSFLAKNKKTKGISTTASGLQYKIMTKGKGKKPSASDKVRVHYEGRLISGKVFDSSYARNQPAEFPIGGVIQGWQEVLPLMDEGAIWEVYIPSDLAYGVRGSGRSIGPNEALIFKIELLKVL